MNVPVRSTLPRSTLSPFALAHKFRSGNLVGLGAQVCMDDESGGQICWDDGTGSGTSTGGVVTTLPVTQTAPFLVDWAESSASAGQPGSIFDAQGNLILPGGGGYTKIGPNGQMTWVTGTPPPGVLGTTTNAQANMYASIVNSLAHAGVQVASISMLQPGQTILPNGTIVGAGQTYGGVNQSALSQFFSHPILIFGILAGLVILEEAAGR